jgi:hypothetical protein
MKLPGITFEGPEIDDRDVFGALPRAAQRLLRQLNGFIAYDGGLHVRGACRVPGWHSLRSARWDSGALHRRYGAMTPDDVPIAQDAVGDQWLLRGGQLWQLARETGTLQATGLSLPEFLAAVEASPIGTLGLHPLLQFRAEGGHLQPGELLNVYPPFCTKESAAGVSLGAIPADERLGFLADLARQLPKEGTFRITFE